MQNITKMRIIHSVFKTPEVEYIKCFFNSIGLLISDEMTEEYNDCSKKLEKKNDSDGIDIVINYFGDDYNPNNNNRLYLYIDIESKICEIYKYPITREEYSEIKTLNSKKETRRELLNILINEIWKNDENNLNAIQYIKDCYISQTEDNDLFYIIQAINCINDVFSSYIISTQRNYIEKKNKEEIQAAKKNNRDAYLENNDFDLYVFLFDYEIEIFRKLWKMILSLNSNLDNDLDSNIHIAYTRIYFEKLFLELYSKLAYMDKKNLWTHLNDDKDYTIRNIYTLIEESYQILEVYPKFDGIGFLLFDLILMTNRPLDNIYNYLRTKSKRTCEPKYYSQIYYKTGNVLEELAYTKKAKEFYKYILEFDAQCYEARFRLSNLMFYERESSYLSKSNLSTIPNNFLNAVYSERNPDYDHFSFATFKDILYNFQSKIMLAKIAMNEYDEFSMTSKINDAYLAALAYECSGILNKISDNNENSYKAFVQYHQHSSPVWLMYRYLKIWTDNIIHDESTKRLVKERLSKWKEN